MRFKLIVGLGNPEKIYHNTYHNAGRLFVEWVAHKKGHQEFKRLRNFFYCKTEGVILAYPAIAMNISGEAVKAAMAYFRQTPDTIAIAHDDSDLTIGNWRLSFEKGAAGHHGIESIIAHLHTQSFHRIRFGIRGQAAPNIPRQKASEFVLSPIANPALNQLHDTFRYCLEALEKETENETPEAVARIELNGTTTSEN